MRRYQIALTMFGNFLHEKNKKVCIRNYSSPKRFWTKKGAISHAKVLAFTADAGDKYQVVRISDAKVIFSITAKGEEE